MRKTRIGWLWDKPERYIGGAELTAITLAQNAPERFEIVNCFAGDTWPDVDAYIVHNCTSYSAAYIAKLEQKPVVKKVPDVWPHGDSDLRAWLLNHSELVVLCSPLQHEAMVWNIEAPVTYVPAAIDLTPFEAATNGNRKGYVTVLRLWPGKGVDRLGTWAAEQGVTIDVYGFGPEEKNVFGPLRYRGPVMYDELPSLLARYETFVFLPSAVETYSRTVVEAWASGCQIVTNGNVGALWWLDNRPGDIKRGAELFWGEVRKVL